MYMCFMCFDVCVCLCVLETTLSQLQRVVDAIKAATAGNVMTRRLVLLLNYDGVLVASTSTVRCVVVLFLLWFNLLYCTAERQSA